MKESRARFQSWFRHTSSGGVIAIVRRYALAVAVLACTLPVFAFVSSPATAQGGNATSTRHTSTRAKNHHTLKSSSSAHRIKRCNKKYKGKSKKRRKARQRCIARAKKVAREEEKKGHHGNPGSSPGSSPSSPVATPAPSPGPSPESGPTIPDTMIDSAPSGPIAQRDVSIAFHSDIGAASFQCKLSGASWSACAGPVHYSSLADGNHEFEVRAVNGESVDPTPAQASWTVDTTPPQTMIETGPASLTKSSQATLTFKASEAATFECNLDSAGWQACTSPKTYSSLTDGSHSFEVRALDAVDNVDLSPAQATWTVDTIPPQTSNTSGPKGKIPTGPLTVGFSSSDPSATFLCSLDGAVASSCSFPDHLPDPGPGPHTFTVKAVDAAGNIDAVGATETWDSVSPQISLCGEISHDETIGPDYAEDYVLTCDVTIDEGATVVVEEGAIVKAEGGVGIQVEGTLDANGTASEPVTFTSINDDSAGGDTNGNGNTTSPAPADWTGIEARPGSTVGLTHAAVSYAGDGLWVNSSGVSISASSFSHNSRSAVQLSGNALGLNGLMGAGNSATANGHVNGIETPCMQLGADSTITSRADWQFEVAPGACGSGLTVPTDKTLTVTAGSTIKVDRTAITVEGTLQADGTGEAPVTFTSFQDDSIGGTVAGDGNYLSSGEPAPADWTGIEARPGSTVGLTHAAVSYAGDGLWVNSSGVSISASSFSHNSRSAVQLSGNALGLNGLMGAGNSATANGHVNGIETPCMQLGADSTITSRADWQFEVAPGACGSGLTVPTDKTLTVTAGSTIKVDRTAITVEGTLQADGTGEAPVTFTSFQDDSIGGTVAGDGNYLSSGEPAPADWTGIEARPGSTVGLTHAAVSYAGDGLWVNSSGVSISASSFSHNSRSAVQLSGNALGLNGLMGAGNSATANGHVNGIETPCMQLGADSTITSRADWQFEVAPGACGSGLTVPTDKTLTVTAGSTIKVDRTAITVEGTLQADGTGEAPATFTSFQDDSIGGTVAGDGNYLSSGEPAPADWTGIEARPGSTVGLTHAAVSYAGDGLWVNSSGVSISASSFSHNSRSAVQLSGNALGLNGLMGAGNSATANGHVNGIETPCMQLGADSTITSRADWQFEVAPGACGSGLTVPTDKTLTVTAGSTIKVDRTAITVEGTLQADGTGEAPVTFTSFQDDSIGGTVAGDGNYLSSGEPAPADWTGIEARPGSTVGLEGTTLRFASAALSVDEGAEATIHGTILDSTVGVSGGEGFVDATEVNWGDSSGPSPIGSGTPYEGGGVLVTPWVGYVAPTIPPNPNPYVPPSTYQCADVAFIGARGSGESPQGDPPAFSGPDDGLGSRAGGAYDGFLNRLEQFGSSPNVKELGVHYRALRNRV